jgi:hypothetical protein
MAARDEHDLRLGDREELAADFVLEDVRAGGVDRVAVVPEPEEVGVEVVGRAHLDRQLNAVAGAAATTTW